MKTLSLTLSTILSLATHLCAASPAPVLGKGVLLDNEALFEGDVTLADDYYTLRSEAGEVRVPKSRVVAVVQSKLQAYEEMQKRVNLRDAEERIRLARWCIQYGLPAQARAQVEFAESMRPGDTRFAGIAQSIIDLTHSSPPAPSTPPPSPSPPAKPAAGAVKEFKPVKFNEEAFGDFVGRIQPMLMNSCIGCHNSGKGGSFDLIRVSMPAGRFATTQNLNAVLSQLSREEPQKSPLLVRSVTAHGDAVSAPLKGETSEAFQMLQQWAALALAPDGSETPLSLAAATPARPVSPKESQPSTPRFPAGDIKPTENGAKPVFGEVSTSKPIPEPKTEPDDPFDPAIFNGEIQPKKVMASPAMDPLAGVRNLRPNGGKKPTNGPSPIPVGPPR